jgi:hypothetical protein
VQPRGPCTVCCGINSPHGACPSLGFQGALILALIGRCVRRTLTGDVSSFSFEGCAATPISLGRVFDQLLSHCEESLDPTSFEYFGWHNSQRASM